MRRKVIPLMLRLPVGLHGRIVRDARRNERSLNGEIIARLLEPDGVRQVVEATINEITRQGLWRP